MRFRASAVAALLVLALAACGRDASGPARIVPDSLPDTVPDTLPDTVAVTLPAGVHALAGIGATLPRTDLAPLAGIIGDASIVALGETYHNSHGFFAMKARIIRHMVEDLGFRAVAWETGWRESRVAAAYVAGCVGTPDAAMRSFYAVWWDVSVRDLLRWMCEYNQAHPTDPVVFYGFDVQEPWQNLPALRGFVARAAPAQDSLLVPLGSCLGASASGQTAFYVSSEYQELRAGTRDPALHARCSAGIDAMEAWIAENATSLAAATSARDVEEARLDLVALRAWEDQLIVAWPQGYHAREIAMATMIRRLRDHHAPGKRTIVWAWNWHIARDYARVHGNRDDAAFTDNRQGVAGMGSYLHQWFGAAYVPIALTGYRIVRPGGAVVPVPTSGLLVEKRLHDLGERWLLVDLRQPIPGPLLPRVGEWGISEMWADPYAQFAAMIHLEDVPAQIIP